MKESLDTTKCIIVKCEKNIGDTTNMITHTTTIELSKKENNSKLIFDYVNILVWPIVVVIVIFIFYKQLKLLIERVVNDSEEISSSYLGFSAKFRNKISEISSSSVDANKIKENLNNTIKQSIIDDFKLLSSYFVTKTYHTRKQASIEISRLSKDLSIDDLCDFASSHFPGERVAAFIGIKVHLTLFHDLDKDEKIIEKISQGLDDGFSRVRYRVIQTISVSNHLTEIFKESLEHQMLEESNDVVKDEIKMTLNQLNNK